MEDGTGGETAVLRDGSHVVVRTVETDDLPLFERGFERFGEQSRYRRFLGFKARLSERELAFYTSPDHHDHEAVGAIEPETGDGLGVARYIREPDDPDVAEAAVAVVDDWQGRGLGALLLERLTARARSEGVRRYRAHLFVENRAMLRLFEQLGCVHKRYEDPQTLDILVDLAGLDDSESPLKHALRAAACGDVSMAG